MWIYLRADFPQCRRWSVGFYQFVFQNLTNFVPFIFYILLPMGNVFAANQFVPNALKCPSVSASQISQNMPNIHGY